jgi:hypothetical protein
LSTLRAPGGGTAGIIAFVVFRAVEKIFLTPFGARVQKNFARRSD